MRLRLSLVGTLMLAATTAAGSDPGALAQAVAPYIDDQTVAIAHVDVARIRLDAIEAMILKVVRSVETQPTAEDGAESRIRAAKRTAERWIADFTKAGGRDLYAIASVADMPEAELPFIVVPLAFGADARAIAGLLCSGSADGPTTCPADDRSGPYPDMICERVGDNVFLGSRSAFERIRDGKPASRPEIAKAFAAVGDAAVQIALVPTADSRRVIEEILPTLPEQIGGGPVTAITRGLLWAAVGIDTHPEPALRLVIQSPDPDAAGALQKVIDRILDRGGKEAAGLAGAPGLDKVLAALRPTRAGNRLTLAVDPQTLTTAVVETLSPSLRRARLLAKRTVSMANMKGIMAALIVWSSDHKNQWPGHLQTLVDAGMIPPQMLVNPAQPDRKVAYVYVRPAVPLNKVDPLSIVLYEAHDTWGDGINVAFADGHVEFLRDRPKFEDLLARTAGRSTTTE